MSRANVVVTSICTALTLVSGPRDGRAAAPESERTPANTDDGAAPISSESEASYTLGPEGPVGLPPAAPAPVQLVPVTKTLAPPTGDRMLIFGSVSMGIGLVGQAIGYGWLHRACSAIVKDEFQDPSFRSAVSCGVGFAGGGATLFLSGIPQLLGMPWIIAGITQRGRRRAFEDELLADGTRRARRPGLAASGAILLGAGVVLWGVAPVAAFRECDDDPSITCSLDATTLGWNFGLGMVTAGSAMLGYAVAYTRSRKRFGTLRTVALAPHWSREGMGLSLRARF
ncbi:MAG: hypothetical protein ACPHRO_07900 [Nannocystaceae bacterium]